MATGQGLLGNNMFAYCGNNPVNNADPRGTAWWPLIIPMIILPLVLGGCESPAPNGELSAAPDLDISTASSESYNCYGNAIKKQIDADPTGYQQGDSTEETFRAVQEDLGGSKNCVRLESIDSPVEDGWYKVALMCGEYDYHFIRLDENGWFNKSGNDPNFRGCYKDEKYVNNTYWLPAGMVNGQVVFALNGLYYHDANGPIFFAVREGWSE